MRFLMLAHVALVVAIGAWPCQGWGAERPVSVYGGLDLGSHFVLNRWPLLQPSVTQGTGRSSSIVTARVAGQLEAVPWLRVNMGLGVLPLTSSNGGGNVTLLYTATARVAPSLLRFEVAGVQCVPEAEAGLAIYHNITGDLGRDADLALPTGLGVRMRTSDALSVRLALRHYITDRLPDTGVGSNLEVALGIELPVWGQQVRKEDAAALASSRPQPRPEANGGRCHSPPTARRTLGMRIEAMDEAMGAAMDGSMESIVDTDRHMNPSDSTSADSNTDSTTNSIADTTKGTSGREGASDSADAMDVRLSETRAVLDATHITFASGSIDIAPEYDTVLQQLAEHLQKVAELRLWVVGRADQTGTESLNCYLSWQRARAAVERLVQLGISRERLVPATVSPEGLQDDVEKDGSLRESRRVEFYLFEPIKTQPRR